MLPLLFTLFGCQEAIDWITGKVDDTVDSQGIEALEKAKALVEEAESSPGKRRVMRLIRRLRSEIDKDKTSGLNGNVIAAAVQRVARDGTISSTEAGLVEDAYQQFLDGKVGRGGRRGKRKGDASADDDKPSADDEAPKVEDQ
ncbi:MAG: hypothetical protein AAF211_34210 [Myxococcota bacterium]